MERLTARSENGTGIYAEPSRETQKWNNNRFYVLQKLADYEDTGLTPEEILEINDSYSEQINIANEFMKERDQWHREALTYAAQLGNRQYNPNSGKSWDYIGVPLKGGYWMNCKVEHPHDNTNLYFWNHTDIQKVIRNVKAVNKDE
jgi:hypothetical protein